MVETVLFDCDGVLVDSESISARALAETLTANGIAVTSDYALNHFIGRNRSHVEGAVATLTGGDLSPAVWDTYRGNRERLFEMELQEVSGARQCLADLASDGCRLGVVTQASTQKATRNLSRTGLLHYFGDAVFSADEVPHGKPSPELYEYALHRLAMPSATAITVDDREEGIAGARAAGVAGLFFNGIHGRVWSGPPTRVIGSLAEVIEFVHNHGTTSEPMAYYEPGCLGFAGGQQ